MCYTLKMVKLEQYNFSISIPLIPSENLASNHVVKSDLKSPVHRNLLEQNLNQIANSDIKIILGDYNAKVGKVNIHKPTNGNEILHNETKNNGIKMIQFAVSKCLNVRSTTFPHKDIHKETRYSETVGQRIN